MINGVPWARPPTWIDPFRRLIRNTLHTRTDNARELGTQLRLALPPDTDQTPPWLKPSAPPSPPADGDTTEVGDTTKPDTG
jgi:hypothetical protein